MRNHLIFGFALVYLVYLAGAVNIDPPIPCQHTSNCTSISKLPKDAFCKDGFCVCPTGKNETRNCSSIDITSNNNKFSGPLVFRPCKLDQDCQLPKGFCNTTLNKCECQKGYVPSTNKQQCLEKARSIGYPCVDDNQCLAFLANTTCQNGHCACKPGYHYTDNACWKIIPFNAACTKTHECSHVAGAVCTERKICECKAETVISSNNRTCLPVAQKFEDFCSEHVQCATTFAETVCDEKRCRCREHYHFEVEMARCFVNKGLNEECGTSFECYQAENAKVTSQQKPVRCVSNRCVCADKFYPKNGLCVNGGTSLASSLLIVAVTLLICGLSSW